MGVGALPVTDSMDKIVGIVSERDFVVLMAGKLTDELVEDYMTEKVISTTLVQELKVHLDNGPE